MPFLRPGRSTYTIELHTPGGTARKSTGTSDKKTAKAIERAVRLLESRREWELLNAVVENKCDVGDLYDAFSTGSLHTLRERLAGKLAECDLEPFVAVWLADRAREIRPDTVAHYRYAVRSLIREGEPFPLSRFTVAALDAWLSHYPGSSGTRRRNFSLVSAAWPVPFTPSTSDSKVLG